MFPGSRSVTFFGPGGFRVKGSRGGIKKKTGEDRGGDVGFYSRVETLTATFWVPMPRELQLQEKE